MHALKALSVQNQDTGVLVYENYTDSEGTSRGSQYHYCAGKSARCRIR